MDALQMLEFPRIREALVELCGTAGGAEILSREEPAIDPREVERKSAYVACILEMLHNGIAPPALAVPPLDQVFATAQPRGAVLDLEELAAVRALITGARELYRFLDTPEEEDPVRRDLMVPLGDANSMLPELLRLVTPGGALREDLIPEIQALRSELAAANREIQVSSERMIRERRDLFREDRPAVRDGRVVLPLVADFRGRFDGIVHRTSSSGETLFVEPPELLDLNNRLAATEVAIHREVQRVLRELTQAVGKTLPELQALNRHLSFLDTIVARGRYGISTDGILIPPGDRPALVRARHPLLGASCVPLTVHWDDGVRMLVISGPNTGGKTVLLKTVGLLAMMRQASIPVPAEPGTMLPHVEYWGVDIGDEQSLDAALSTFSGHLKNIVAITRQATPASLILLDELGTGTDPEEGTALAMAVVDHLLEVGCFILITTHHGALKHWGYTRGGAANASMEFDHATGRPTYRVIPQLPGGSFALESAGRLGLPEHILERARAYHEQREDSVSEIIVRLSAHEGDLVRQKDEARRAAEELAREREKTEELRRALENREALLKREGLQSIRQELHEARKSVEAALRSFRESRSPQGPDAQQELRRAVEPLETLYERHAEDASSGDPGTRDSATSPPLTEVPSRGTVVRHRETGQTGEVLRARGRNVEVQFGAVRMTVSLNQLAPGGPEETGKRSTRDPVAPVFWRTAPVPLELDIRGYRHGEAMEELQRYIDGAVLAGMSVVSVIHGTGTGALQHGVQNYLRDRPEVASFRFALPEDGGFGKTVVELTSAAR